MNKRNYTIDFLRILFILIICVHHFQPYISTEFIKNGHLGVEFFFILSGFYLYKKFSKDKELTSWKYTIDKVKKFFPLYICSLLIYMIIVISMELINGNFDFEKILFVPIAEIFMIQNVRYF